MSRVNNTRYAVLGMLSLRPMSGYDIKKSMAHSTESFWTESDGQLYPIFRQLEKEKLIQSECKYCGAREKKVYQITKKGQEILIEWLQIAPEVPMVRSELLLKLFFGHHVSTKVHINHLEKYRDKLKEQKLRHEWGIKHLKTAHKDEPSFPYLLLCVNKGLKSVESSIQWCDEAIRKLKTLKKIKET